ncbi:hypothetical protein [Dickeya zeae]|uniref:hypothetical protein n=1 Tax=Dickeya zeae TaxID=204042 RepID=UPI0006ACD275|nr:hypothetical protein [Dickeya zeae]
MTNDKTTQSRIAEAVELLKQAAPQMLAQKGPLDTSPEISREESPDAALCDFYDANSWTELVRGLVNHVEQLQETVKRNVKPWDDTFPPTLLPAYIERIKQADAAARAAIAANSPVIPDGWNWTDEQCLEFLSVAFRHCEIKGDVAFDEIRQGVQFALAAAPQPDQVGAAVRDVIAERQRQITTEGWTPEHDDEHVGFEMSFAASTYILHIAQSYGGQPYKHIAPSEIWPWDLKWLKFTPGPRRSLVKAAALIVAEIERIDRCALQNKGGEA